MLNFTHKPCCPDGKKALEIAQKIGQKTENEQKNELDLMLKIRLETKLMTKTNLADINDFPKLSEQTIKDDIVFGSFQIEQSKSYLSDLLQFSTAYMLNDLLGKKLFNRNISIKLENKELKLIAVEIISRHKRSEIKC
jgi:hypothetical protein